MNLKYELGAQIPLKSMVAILTEIWEEADR